MKLFQKTIKKNIKFEGIALHTGAISVINLLPADINHGISFKRIDLKNSKPIIANWANVKTANLCTMLKNDCGDTISTIEHLMFSFYSLGLTNIIVEVDGPEVPILDGSSKIFIDEILKNKIYVQNAEAPNLEIIKKVEVKEENKFIKYEPTNKKYLEIDYTLNYNDKFIKKQKKKIIDIQKNYSEICSARTYCHQEDLEKIFAMGLAKGGSLDNAIVISGTKILNQEGLRYKDEFVRHKILDCVGDIYLSGFFLTGKITCNQGGHQLTNKLLRKIFSNKDNFVKSNNISKKKVKINKSNINYKIAI